jgi:hypothetical protein
MIKLEIHSQVLAALVQAFPHPANPQRALDKYTATLVSTKKIKWYR